MNNKSLSTNRNPSTKVIMQHLNAAPSSKEALAYYRSYFNFNVDSDYYKSYPSYNEDGIKPSFARAPKKCSTLALLEDGSRKALSQVDPYDNVINTVPSTLTDLHLIKHLLSATQSLHPDIAFWLHMSADATSNWLVIDRDYRDFQNDSMHYLDKVKRDYQKMVEVFGVPNIAVTSRGKDTGIHFHYKLNRDYPINQINDYAVNKMEIAGLAIKPGVWEIFPKAETSMPPLPFGMNSRQVIDGIIQPELGVDALVKWYHSKPNTNTIDISSCHLPLANAFEDTQIKILNSPIIDSSDSPKTLAQYKEHIEDLFRNPHNYKRQNAQHLLKFHTQIFLNLGERESIEFAWNWLQANIDSEDIKKRPGWAYNNLASYFTKKHLHLHLTKNIKYNLSLDQILTLLKELESHHSKICSLIVKSNARTNGEVFSVYSMYIYLYAERIRQKVSTAVFNVKTSHMKTWPGCSNMLYKQALDVLVKLNLIELLEGYCYQDEAGSIRRKSNSIKLKELHKNNTGDLIDLNKHSLAKLFKLYLKEEIGISMFGQKGYASRSRRNKIG